jgi:hypothetical protein
VVLEEYAHEGLTYGDSGQSMKLDFYLPGLKLAFEYQGKQHYETLAHFGTLEKYQSRDKLKSEICRSWGISKI